MWGGGCFAIIFVEPAPLNCNIICALLLLIGGHDLNTSGRGWCLCGWAKVICRQSMHAVIRTLNCLKWKRNVEKTL
jgi:hypothetical protein